MQSTLTPEDTSPKTYVRPFEMVEIRLSVTGSCLTIVVKDSAYGRNIRHGPSLRFRDDDFLPPLVAVESILVLRSAKRRLIRVRSYSCSVRVLERWNGKQLRHYSSKCWAREWHVFPSSGGFR